ncbi:MAG: hypothetical protein U0872_01820 [Planctomycetaceae bacterium]
MDHKSNDAYNALIKMLWPDETRKRGQSVILLWGICDFLWMAIGVLKMATASVALQMGDVAFIDAYHELARSAATVVFAVAWAIISFRAYRKRRWAIWAGIYASFIGFAPVVLLSAESLYHLAIDREVLALASIVALFAIAMLASWGLKGGANIIKVAAYCVFCVLIVIALTWRLIASEHSYNIESAILCGSLLWPLLSFMPHYWRACQTMLMDENEL